MATSDAETHQYPSVERASSQGEFRAGTPVGEYVIDGLIAEGGCGAVYVATHRSLPRRAAIKILHAILASSPRMVERFVREVQVVNLLRHPNIVEIFELGQLEDGRPFYAMEYLDGMTVDTLLRARGRMAAEEALEILEPVAAALEAAHEAGIIHRDVKASNVSITLEGARRTVKLLDFGIAKLATPELGASGLTSVGRQLGTPSAMAPEQILGEPIDARIDIYALGVLLYRLLTGRLPFFSSNHGELARMHLEEPAPRPSLVANVAASVDAVVLRCLEKRPERRFDTAQSFLLALREAVGRPIGRGDEGRLDMAVPAVGVSVELRMDTHDDDLDDALADDLGTILDRVEERLRREGYLLTLVTGSAILGVRPVAGGPDDQCRGRRAAVEVAASLYEDLARRAGADPRVQPMICVHFDQALVRRSSRPEIVGGAIVRTSAWAPPAGERGLCATAQAMEGVQGFDTSPGPGAVLRIRRTEGTGRSRAPVIAAPRGPGGPRTSSEAWEGEAVAAIWTPPTGLRQV